MRPEHGDQARVGDGQGASESAFAPAGTTSVAVTSSPAPTETGTGSGYASNDPGVGWSNARGDGESHLE